MISFLRNRPNQVIEMYWRENLAIEEKAMFLEAIRLGENSMKNRDDSYGSAIRQSMKRSMEKPAEFRPLNRRVDNYDRVMTILCWTTGILAMLCIAIEIVYQILKHAKYI